MKPTTSSEIRRAFLEYFEELNHQVVSSSPLPAYDNPTLLFTNAGMNQFVNVFLGKEERSYKRAATSQKCMRVQGKHNDLENVGPSPRHHTFFEMLGNFSFGDYFKEGAIRFAYTFMTEICQIPAEKLWFTVHVSDDDAYNIWVDKVGVDPGRVLRMGDKTNFWMMGEVGPCGPTSEIHYDWGPEACTCNLPDCNVLLDNDCGRWLEVWNLVFMQYDQAEDGSRTPLPKPGVDTGMGLERITSIQQQQPVNYNTDLFAPAMQQVQEMLGHSDEEKAQHETGYRVIADHGRAATFMIGDGVLPGNEGRAYVLRMVIRRAARFGRKIGFNEPFLADIAQVYIDKMAEIYPELKRNRDLILRTVTNEEKRFHKVLDSSLAQLDQILDELAAAGQSEIPGETVFNLYATHGLPLEITRDVAGERGFTVDEAGYRAARTAHSQASGAGAIGEYDQAQNVYGRLLAELIEQGHLESAGVDYDPYGGARLESEILALIKDGQSTGVAETGERVEIVTAATPFYVQAGGEVSDTGWIRVEKTGSQVRVDDVQQPENGLVIHIGEVVEGTISVGQVANLEVDNQRRWDIRRNHTATHLLHRELRAALGTHVTQQGSLVAPDRLRFDFSHDQAVDPETLSTIEKAINEAILENHPVTISHMPQKKAIEAGAMALFGEKYGEVVRTIRIGDPEAPAPYSFELCGGLHVKQTGDIGPFYFTTEEAVGAGLRRVEAVTGHGAQEFTRQRMVTLERLSQQLNAPVSDLEGRVSGLLEEHKSLQKEIARLRRGQARQQFEQLMGKMEEVEGIPLLRAVVEVADMDSLREMADWFRDRVKSGVAVLAALIDQKPLIIVAVTEDLNQRGLKAGDIVREVAKIVGGGGGGKPTLAQAGGKDPDKLPEALAAVPGLVKGNVE